MSAQTRWLLGNVTVADVLVVTVSSAQLLADEHEVRIRWLCQVFILVTYSGIILSIYLLLTLSVQVWLSIKLKANYATMATVKRIQIVTALLWILAFGQTGLVIKFFGTDDVKAYTMACSFHNLLRGQAPIVVGTLIGIGVLLLALMVQV